MLVVSGAAVRGHHCTEDRASTLMPYENFTCRFLMYIYMAVLDICLQLGKNNNNNCDEGETAR